MSWCKSARGPSDLGVPKGLCWCVGGCVHGCVFWRSCFLWCCSSVLSPKPHTLPQNKNLSYRRSFGFVVHIQNCSFFLSLKPSIHCYMSSYLCQWNVNKSLSSQENYSAWNFFMEKWLENIIWNSLEELLNTALKFAFICYLDLHFGGLVFFAFWLFDFLLCNLHMVCKCTPKQFNCFCPIVRPDCLGKQRVEIQFIKAI